MLPAMLPAMPSRFGRLFAKPASRDDARGGRFVVVIECLLNQNARDRGAAAYPAVNPEVVAALPIPSPPETLIDGFHAATSASFDLIETNNEQTQHLTQLRDWLLPLLMNGQVAVT